MAPSLHISAGPDASSLEPLAVNHDEIPLTIDSPNFRGRATVRIKSFTGHDPEGVEHNSDCSYFNEERRRGITWSIQIQGRFLGEEEVSADDILFGNAFERSIASHLPYGTSLALQFVKVVDPNMQHDLYCDKPWAFSPFVATITHLNVQRLEKESLTSSSSAKDDFKVEGYPAFPTPDSDEGKNSTAAKGTEGYTVDDVSALVLAGEKDDRGRNQLASRYKESGLSVDASTLAGLNWPADQASGDKEAAAARRKLLGADAGRRQKVVVTPQDVFTADFCNGFLDFNTLNLNLPFSGGLHFDLKKYWDGQPVNYYCKNRKTGKVYFVVSFNIQDMDA